MTKNKLDLFQKKIKVNFRDPQKLTQALVHRSFLNEQKKISQSNERYEFLGDAILELWATKTLFDLFPSFHEGNMTNLRAKLVRTETLSKAAQQIGLDQLILLSQGEEKGGGRQNQSILADSFESLICAIYLDQGLKTVEKFLNSIFLSKLKKFSRAKTFKDPKSIFQELSQKKEGITPHYQVLKEEGPDHQKNFVVAAYIGNKKITTGQGNSKQSAQEEAAIKAIRALHP
jgi:ribonuclease III